MADRSNRCRTCGAEIRWEASGNGRPTPVSVKTGQSHFRDCPQAKQWRGKSRNDPESPKLQTSWHLLDDDVWIMMMASYWRIQSAIDRAVKEGTAGLPDFMAIDVEKEIRETAYAEERRIWSAGMDRLMELYGVPEGSPDASGAVLEQAVLL